MADPVYILSAAPLDQVQFPNFFDSGSGSLMAMLEHPKSFRYAGWDLETLDRAHIVDGECLEVSNGDRKILRLYEDGTLLLKASANSDFLGWGRQSDQFAKAPRLNPLAVIEITTAFVHFYQALLPRFEQEPSKIKFKLELHDAEIDGNKLYLIPGQLNSIAWLMDDKAHVVVKRDIEKELNINAHELSQEPDQVAYQIVTRFYLFFGIPSDKIPYVKDDGTRRRIDTDAFSKAS